MMYAGRTLLGYREQEVWRLTPRFLQSQIKVHFDLERAKWGGSKEENEQDIDHIDQIPGWG